MGATSTIGATPCGRAAEARSGEVWFLQPRLPFAEMSTFVYVPLLVLKGIYHCWTYSFILSRGAYANGSMRKP